MVLFCISLMANDVECLFMYLSAIYLHWKKVFSDIYDLQIFFSHSVHCLFAFLVVSFGTKIFKF